MKTPLLVALAAVLVVFPGVAFAHSKHHRKHHVHKVVVVRHVKTVYVGPTEYVAKPHHKHRVVVVVGDRALRAALRDVKQAKGLIKLAVPVYEGHREEAIAWCNVADQEIKAGMSVAPGAPPLNLTYATPFVKAGGKHKGRLYTDAQIQASDAQLQAAIPLLQAAIDSLARAAGDHGGYRTQAESAVSQALQEVRACLRSE
jgi:hypothetical protein